MKTQNPKLRLKAKKINEGTFKSFSDVDLSKVKGSVSEIFTTNFERFNTCKTFDDVVALCHELLDDSGLDTNWTRKFFYQLDQIEARNPNPRRAYEQALMFVNNARMKGMGLGMGRGAGFYEDEQLNEGWIGGILGYISGGILAALAGVGLLPAVALVAIGAYGGHKIQKYFSNKSALKNLDDSEIALLAALSQNGAKGLTKDNVEQIASASKTDVSEQNASLDKLVDMGVAVNKSGRYVITRQGREILQDAGFNQEALNKDAAELQKKALDESAVHTYEIEFDYDDGTGTGNATETVEAASLTDAKEKLSAQGYGEITEIYYASEDGKELDDSIINSYVLESMDDGQKEEFKKKLRAGKVEFKYKKKDGSERKAVGTMDPKLMDLPEKKTQSDVDGAEKKNARKLPADSVFYYDLDAKGFRSFKMQNFIGYID